MTLFIALNRIREEQDPSLQFDFCCRAGICGSCAMLINGRPDLACHTKTKDLPEEITLLPLPVFKLIGDLSVDTGTWFRDMNEQVQSWIHTDKVFDPRGPGRAHGQRNWPTRSTNWNAASNAAVAWRPAARPTCARISWERWPSIGSPGSCWIRATSARTKEYFEVVGTDDGIFGCLGLLGCEDVCPKDIPLQDQLGHAAPQDGLVQHSPIL